MELKDVLHQLVDAVFPNHSDEEREKLHAAIDGPPDEMESKEAVKEEGK